MGLLPSPNNATIDLTRFVYYTSVTELIRLANNIVKVASCKSEAFVCYDIDFNYRILISKCSFSTKTFTVYFLVSNPGGRKKTFNI